MSASATCLGMDPARVLCQSMSQQRNAYIFVRSGVKGATHPSTKCISEEGRIWTWLKHILLTCGVLGYVYANSMIVSSKMVVSDQWWILLVFCQYLYLFLPENALIGAWASVYVGMHDKQLNVAAQRARNEVSRSVWHTSYYLEISHGIRWAMKLNTDSYGICQFEIILNSYHHFVLTKFCACVTVRQVGRTNLDQEEYGEYTVTHVQRHPGHDPLTEDLDVALLKLDRPVDGAELATLVAAESSEMLENFLQSKDMSVMGFGKTLERGLLSKKLLAGTVQHVPRAECNSAERFGGQVTSNMLCAQGDGVDACDGDSGGPLILSRNSRDFLVGVVSWGIGCGGPKYPGVYVDINAVRPWILEEIDNSGQWPEVK